MDRLSKLKIEKGCCFSGIEVISSFIESRFMELNFRRLRCEWWMRKKVDLLSIGYFLRKFRCIGEEKGFLL